MADEDYNDMLTQLSSDMEAPGSPQPEAPQHPPLSSAAVPPSPSGHREAKEEGHTCPLCAFQRNPPGELQGLFYSHFRNTHADACDDAGGSEAHGVPRRMFPQTPAKATATASKKTKQKDATEPGREGGAAELAQERGRQLLPRPKATGAGGGGGGRAQDFVTPQNCDSLTADAERAVGQVLPTQSQEQQRREVMLDLNSILTTMQPELEAHLYGSAGSGFGSRTSDLDVSIMKVRRTPQGP